MPTKHSAWIGSARLLAAVIGLCVAATAEVAVSAPDAGSAAARTAAAAPRRPPVVVSPEVAADGRVTLRLYAPEAKTVTVWGQWLPQGTAATPLVRGPDGVWAVTTAALAPGLYEYGFKIDGASAIDPANPLLKPERAPRTSLLEVAGQPPLRTAFQDVPHGTVHLHDYNSKSLGRRRRLRVYTPPGYETRPGTRYPVLYLLHGHGDNEATWTEHGRAHWILDALLAERKAQPMIVVMTDGHAVPIPGEGDWATRLRVNSDAFARDLLEDVMPLVEATYRTQPRADRRAIAGLSMGGGQTLTIALTHPERFGWVVAMSSVIPHADVLAGPLGQPAALNRAFRLLWIGVGKDDFLAGDDERFATELRSKGINHMFNLTEGNHSWPVWRRYLEDVVPLLFVPRQAAPAAAR